MSAELLTRHYDYALPKGAIASSPIHPRDHAKLLVFDRKNNTITHSTFKHLLEFIPKGCDIFLNDTRVIKARIFGHKKISKIQNNRIPQGGGRVELLLNKPLDTYHFLVMIRGKVHKEEILYFDNHLHATIINLNEDGSRIVTFSQHEKLLSFEELVLILDQIGHIPLPPYIQRSDNKEDERDYQTIFAKTAGAVAAPTASLHFTPELFKRLKQQHTIHTITLHVGAGTFRPVDTEAILDHPMHAEYFDIPRTSAEAIDTDTPLLAIGTTVTRTLEYYVRTGKTYGECDLFLHPMNPPQRVTHLLTNFHLPKSTLIMLVSAFVGREKTLALYKKAIQKKYRFFSYGDAMLIL